MPVIRYIVHDGPFPIGFHEASDPQSLKKIKSLLDLKIPVKGGHRYLTDEEIREAMTKEGWSAFDGRSNGDNNEVILTKD
jgi:hypothetical protein